MGCPFHSSGGDSDESEQSGDGGPSNRTREIDRRAFVKSAVAIGGTGALTAALSAETAAGHDDGYESMPYPTGDPSERPERQHLWSPAGQADEFGNPRPPSHQVVLLLDYVGDDPTEDGMIVERSLRQLERAFAYDQAEGLLFNVGYSPAYFKRHHDAVPRGVDLREPRSVSPYADPELDRQDVFVQLASDRGSIVLAAESALFGDIEEVNGVGVAMSVDGIFDLDERRSVFVGAPRPRERIGNENIEGDSPLSMGFDSAYADSIPHEDRITVEGGPWAGSTVAQVSKLRLRLDEWYERDRDRRIDEMFAPEYTPEDVGDFGEGLGEGSGREDGEGWSHEITARIEGDARREGVVGHSQKVARARDEDFAPKLLRRDGNITTDGGDGGLSFVGLVESIDDWLDVAEAMYDPEMDDRLDRHDATGGKDNGNANGGKSGTAAGTANANPRGDADDNHHQRSGIAAQMDVRARGNFLIPPRSLRALPPARPD